MYSVQYRLDHSVSNLMNAWKQKSKIILNRKIVRVRITDPVNDWAIEKRVKHGT